jgi:hypothetical protein
MGYVCEGFVSAVLIVKSIREIRIRRCKGTTTLVVSAVFDKQAELVAAVADTYAIVSFLALHCFQPNVDLCQASGSGWKIKKLKDVYN